MREFATFLPQFWTTGPGKKFRGNPEAQLVCAYLLTAPASNHIGIYYLPIGTMAHDLGISPEEASKGLRRAIEGAFCAYDEASEHVFVYEMAQIQILERAVRLKASDKKIIGLKRELRKYRESVHLIDFVNRYRQAFHLMEPEFSENFSENCQGPSKPLRSPSQGASLKRQEKEKEKEKETEREKETARGCARAMKRSYGIVCAGESKCTSKF